MMLTNLSGWIAHCSSGSSFTLLLLIVYIVHGKYCGHIVGYFCIIGWPTIHIIMHYNRMKPYTQGIKFCINFFTYPSYLDDFDVKYIILHQNLQICIFLDN